MQYQSQGMTIYKTGRDSLKVGMRIVNFKKIWFIMDFFKMIQYFNKILTTTHTLRSTYGE